MSSTTLFNHAPLDLPVDVSGYRIELAVCDGDTTLCLAGDLDSCATSALREVVQLAGGLPGVLRVHADGVLGADLDSFDALFEAAASRQAAGRPGVVLASASDAVHELFDVLTLPHRTPCTVSPDAMRQ